MNKKIYNWIEDATTRYEREKINSKRRVAYAKNLERKGMNAFIRNSFVMVSAIAITSVTVGGFFSDNVVSFQSPIVIEKRTSDFQNPIAVVSAKETSKKTIVGEKTEKEIVLSQPHGQILWKIYQLETQRGKEDYCRNNNKGFGGFGVMYNGEIICYETFEKAVERANHWYGEIAKGRTQDQALCKWSGHGEVDGCDYAHNFQFVK